MTAALLLLLLTASPTNSRAGGPVIVTKTNKALLVDVRYLTEWVGAGGILDSQTGRLALSLNARTVRLAVGSATAYVDGVPHKLQAPVFRAGEAVYAPLNQTASMLGVEVDLDQDHQRVAWRNAQTGETMEVPMVGKQSPTSMHIIRPPSVQATAILRTAVQRKSKGDFDGSVRELRNLLKTEPDYAEAHLALGWVLEATGDLRGARDEFSAAFRLTLNQRVLSEARSALKSVAPPEEKSAVPPPVVQPARSPRWQPSVPQHPIVGTWVIPEHWRSLDGRDTETESTYVFRPDGTGSFSLGWSNGRPDIHVFEWHLDSTQIVIEFQPGARDAWREWPSRMSWSVSDDGERLTLGGHDDIRGTLWRTYTGLAGAMIEGGIDGGPRLLSPIEPAVYHRSE